MGAASVNGFTQTYANQVNASNPALGGLMQQLQLHHDTVYDALASAVQAAGGIKKVASQLWPTLASEIAAQRLRSGLNPEHAQKLDPAEVLQIAKIAREAGDHSLMHYLGQELAYEIRPIEPKDELAHLYTEYVESTRSLSRLAEKIERLEQRVRIVK